MVTKDFDWLRADCEFRMQVHGTGYRAREVIPAGDWLYDPQVRWADPDGSVVIADIGGQAQRGWDPAQGHGAIWRLNPDDSLTAIVKPGTAGFTAPLRPELAPAWFGEWGGQIFTVAQGRPGAREPIVATSYSGSTRTKAFRACSRRSRMRYAQRRRAGRGRDRAVLRPGYASRGLLVRAVPRELRHLPRR